MSRLSIIIPHRHNDPRLETTLISVLENRPADAEVIVVHDGSYRDEYSIGDEARLIEGQRRSSTTKLLNTAVQSIRSELVAVVLDGTTVQPGWLDAATERMDDASVCSVAIAAATQTEPTAGISPLTRTTARAVLSGKIDASLGSAQYAGPNLACGLYRRNTLQTIGGWCEQLSVNAADVELAWLMQTAGLSCESAPGKLVELSPGASRNADSNSLAELAELCVAYGITGSGMAAAVGGWFTAALGGKLGSASSWASGLMGGSHTRAAIARLNLAQQALAEEADQPSVLPYPTHNTNTSSLTRAA